MAKVDLTKYTNMVNNAASKVKISSTIFKAFIADIKSVIDENDDLRIGHEGKLVTDTGGVHGLEVEQNGVWTPGISFGDATTGITYSTQSGTYQRIGNIVFLKGVVGLTSKGSAVGAAKLTGLPFATRNIRQTSRLINYQNITFLAGTIGISLVSIGISDKIAIFLERPATTSTAAQNTIFNDNSVFEIDMFYIV